MVRHQLNDIGYVRDGSGRLGRSGDRDDDGRIGIINGIEISRGVVKKGLFQSSQVMPFYHDLGAGCSSHEKAVAFGSIQASDIGDDGRSAAIVLLTGELHHYETSQQEQEEY